MSNEYGESANGRIYERLEAAFVRENDRTLGEVKALRDAVHNAREDIVRLQENVKDAQSLDERVTRLENRSAWRDGIIAGVGGVITFLGISIKDFFQGGAP
jgi:hypothetical protein